MFNFLKKKEEKKKPFELKYVLALVFFAVFSPFILIRFLSLFFGKKKKHL